MATCACRARCTQVLTNKTLDCICMSSSPTCRCCPAPHLLQGMHQMYGLSGEEMDERQQLFYDRLRFTLAPGACDIEVVKPQQALAPAGAW